MLSSVSALKTYFRKAQADTDQDTYFTQLLGAADRIVKTFCKRWLEQQNLTEYYDGSGAEAIALRSRPVTAVPTVFLDPAGYYGQRSGGFSSGTQLTAGVDYVLRMDYPAQSGGGVQSTWSKSGLLLRVGGGTIGGPLGYPWGDELRRGTLTARAKPIWPRGIGNVKVIYSAGFPPEAIPDDLVFAVHGLCGYLRQSTPVGAPIMQDSSAESVAKMLERNVNLTPELGSIRETLMHYREVVL